MTVYRKQRFTLLEILIVVSVIFVLAGMTLAVMGPVKRHIRDTKTKAQMKQFELVMEQYYQDWGYYPQQPSSDVITANFFASLVDTEQGTPFFKDEYFEYDTTDDSTNAKGDTYYRPVNAHSQPFYYVCPGKVHPEAFDIWCAGYDGLFGGNPIATPTPIDADADPESALAVGVRAEDANDDIANWKKLY